MVYSRMHLKSKPPYVSALKHFAFDQKNSIFLPVPIGILSIMEVSILTLNNLFINYEFFM